MIKQSHISGAIKFFRKDFNAHWGMVNYHSPKQSAIFLGAYNELDLQRINAHQGFKVVVLAGADLRNLNKLIPSRNLVLRTDATHTRYFKQHAHRRFQWKNADIAFKDYSQFQPCELGDKVYCYVGGPGRVKHFRIDTIKAVEAKSRFQFIYGMFPNTIETMIEEYYKPSFINLRINTFAGHTTSLEMAHMGRRSVSNRIGEPWYLNYAGVDDIVALIEKESTKIGTIQPSQIPATYFAGPEWKDEAFWLT